MSKSLYTEKEIREICSKFDFGELVRQLGSGETSNGFIAEITNDYNRRSGRIGRGKATIPDFVLLNALENTRAHSSTRSITGGENLINTDVLADRYIHALTAKTVLGRAGIETLSGLTGNIRIPKGGVVSSAWLEDGAAAPEINATFGQIEAHPHTIGAYADFSRQLDKQSSVGFGNLIAGIIVRSIAVGIEKAAFAGTGANGEPLGLANTAGIQTATLSATPTKAELVAMWSAIFDKDVEGLSPAYVGNAKTKGLLCSTLDTVASTSATSGHYLCENGKVEEYDFHMTNNVAENTLWFGDWSNLMLCAWSGVDIVVDRFSLSKMGGIRVVCLQDVDFVVRHPEAFVKATVASAS